MDELRMPIKRENMRSAIADKERKARVMLRMTDMAIEIERTEARFDRVMRGALRELVNRRKL